MRFTTTAIFFGMTSAAIAGTAIAAPGSEIKGSYKAVQMTEGFFPGDPNASCYCCPSSGSGSNCGLVNEDGRCQNGDVLICCDLREQACSNLATLAVPDGSTGLLDLGGLLSDIVDLLL